MNTQRLITVGLSTFGLLTAAAWQPAVAQALMPSPMSAGLKLKAPIVEYFDMPSYHWSVYAARPVALVGDGSRLNVGGGYGWQFSNASKLALNAGVGVAGGALRLPSAIDATVANGDSNGPDVNFNLLWNWQFSKAFALTTALTVNYGLTDSQPANPWGADAHALRSSSYIGLRYRF